MHSTIYIDFRCVFPSSIQLEQGLREGHSSPPPPPQNYIYVYICEKTF